MDVPRATTPFTSQFQDLPVPTELLRLILSFLHDSLLSPSTPNYDLGLEPSLNSLSVLAAVAKRWYPLVEELLSKNVIIRSEETLETKWEEFYGSKGDRDLALELLVSNLHGQQQEGRFTKQERLRSYVRSVDTILSTESFDWPKLAHFISGFPLLGSLSLELGSEDHSTIVGEPLVFVGGNLRELKIIWLGNKPMILDDMVVGLKSCRRLKRLELSGMAVMDYGVSDKKEGNERSGLDSGYGSAEEESGDETDSSSSSLGKAKTRFSLQSLGLSSITPLTPFETFFKTSLSTITSLSLFSSSFPAIKGEPFERFLTSLTSLQSLDYLLSRGSTTIRCQSLPPLPKLKHLSVSIPTNLGGQGTGYMMKPPTLFVVVPHLREMGELKELESNLPVMAASLGMGMGTRIRASSATTLPIKDSCLKLKSLVFGQAQYLDLNDPMHSIFEPSLQTLDHLSCSFQSSITSVSRAGGGGAFPSSSFLSRLAKEGELKSFKIQNDRNASLSLIYNLLQPEGNFKSLKALWVQGSGDDFDLAKIPQLNDEENNNHRLKLLLEVGCFSSDPEIKVFEVAASGAHRSRKVSSPSKCSLSETIVVYNSTMTSRTDVVFPRTHQEMKIMTRRNVDGKVEAEKLWNGWKREVMLL